MGHLLYNPITLSEYISSLVSDYAVSHMAKLKSVISHIWSFMTGKRGKNRISNDTIKENQYFHYLLFLLSSLPAVSLKTISEKCFVELFSPHSSNFNLA